MAGLEGAAAVTTPAATTGLEGAAGGLPVTPEIGDLENGVISKADAVGASNLAVDAGKKLDTDPNAGINVIARVDVAGNPDTLPIQGDEAKTEDNANNAAKDGKQDVDTNSSNSENNQQNTAGADNKKNPNPGDGKENAEQTKTGEPQGDQKTDSKTEENPQAQDEKRMNEIKQKIKNRTATHEEMKELNDHGKTERQRQELEDKVMNGDATEEDIDRLDKLNKGEKETDSQDEKTAEKNTEQSTTDKQLQEMQQKFKDMLENNKDKLETAMVTVSAKDLLLLLQALGQAKEADPKKKETKLSLLLKVLGIITASLVMETAKTVIPPGS